MTTGQSADLSNPKTIEQIICADEWASPGSNVMRSVRIVARKEPGAPKFSYFGEIESTPNVWIPWNPPLRMLLDNIVPTLYQTGLVNGRDAGLKSEGERMKELLAEVEKKLDDSETVSACCDVFAEFRRKVEAGEKAEPSVEDQPNWK